MVWVLRPGRDKFVGRIAFMASSDDERRRQPRVQVQMAITVMEASGDKVLRATDINKRGFFIKTDAPKPVRRLVRMRVPMGDEELQVLGMVVHRIVPYTARERGIDPGMGVQLYGLGPLAKERWDAWVDELYERYPAPFLDGALPGKKPPPPPILRRPGSPQTPPPIDAIRRLHKRYNMAWQVRLLGEGSIEETHTTDISIGGAFVLTKQVFSVGDSVDISLIHPTDGRAFAVEGKIVRVIGAPSKRPGIAVQFHTEEPDVLEKFIQDGIPEEEEDDALTLVDSDDPMLE